MTEQQWATDPAIREIRDSGLREARGQGEDSQAPVVPKAMANFPPGRHMALGRDVKQGEGWA